MDHSFWSYSFGAINQLSCPHFKAYICDNVNIIYIDTYLEPSPFGQLFLQESGNHCPIEAIKTQISTGWWFGT